MKRQLTNTGLSRWQGLRLAALTLVLLEGAAGLAHAGARETLPVQPAQAVVEPAGTALPADQSATMIATLQKQLVEQQALLRQLQENMGAVKPGVAADAAAAPASGTVPAPAPAAPSAVAAPMTPAGGVMAVPGEAHLSAGTAVVADAPAASAVSPAGNVPPAAPAAPTAGPSPEAPAPVSGAAVSGTPQTAAERQAYASGVSVWREIESSMTAQRSMGIELDPAWVMQGLQDMANRQPLRMSREQVDTIMVTLNEIYMEKAREARERQQTMGRAFQSAFMKEKGASRDAGSLYRVVDAGRGKRIKASDMVTLSVTGTLPDGTVFDGSGQSGQSKTAKVGALMPAVAIGLQKIARGGHIKVVVPPEKGYGDAGLPPVIPGGATLIFDITVADEG
ncbi:FKBP-type peptidyl-prolyl cis-trans isomerase [Enterobacter asburiae]|uniref:FKBP-type peptidyl-prolyl cis-trans isomerase n=1 Tax=Enterobacter asburiae TaxID=61645 RepID=UPI000F86E4AE|nr:FKBP-type peptidyl-prolyl cis-trans isomerase [Enterobacter asburiae]RTP87921.1 hypothetical protein EKN34_13440 [Enterobacter asburiae]